MTGEQLAVLALFAVAACALVALNVVLQRRARPDRGDERIAGCCGMALPVEITRTAGDDR
jgi:hypothetical protein